MEKTKISPLLIIGIISGVAMWVALGILAASLISNKTDTKSTETSEVTVISEETTDSAKNAPSETETTTQEENKPLTNEEIKKELKYATDLYLGWCGCAFEPELDYDDTITVNEEEYARIINGRFNNTDELKAELKRHLSPDIYRDYPETNYKMHNGEMYGSIYLGQGGDESPDIVTLNVEKNTGTECVFTVTGTNSYSTKTLTYHYRMVKENGNWVFTELDCIFSLYHNDDLPWTN